MPYSQDPTTYPADFYEIPPLVWASKEKKFTLPFTTRSAAHAFRGRFNAWRNIMAKQSVEETMFSQEEYTCLRALEVKLVPSLTGRKEADHRGDACAIVFEHRDYTETSQAIRAAVEELKRREPSLRGTLSDGSKVEEERDPFESFAKEGRERGRVEDLAEKYLRLGASGRPPHVCDRCSADNMCWQFTDVDCDLLVKGEEK